MLKKSEQSADNYDSTMIRLYKSATNELLDLDESRNRRAALSSPFRKSIRENRG